MEQPLYFTLLFIGRPLQENMHESYVILNGSFKTEKKKKKEAFFPLTGSLAFNVPPDKYPHDKSSQYADTVN